MKKYCVHVGMRFTTDIYVIAENENTACELAENYACNLPIEDFEFADSDIDSWEEDFDSEDADIIEEV